jgi:ABC-type multidrug transport system fused ATPase/permease subunit
LLDDPLSAVDAHVGKTIWNDAIVGYLIGKGATVLIASHQTHFFSDADRIM